MLTNDTKSFVTLDTYTTRLYFHIAVQFRKLQFPQRAFAYFLRDRTNIHVFSVPYRFTRALWYRATRVPTVFKFRGTRFLENASLSLCSRGCRKETVNGEAVSVLSGKWSMPPRQASTLSLFVYSTPPIPRASIPYSPGNIFTKRGGSQLADSKERFDGCVWKVKCRFSQIESGWETIVRSLEWRRRIQPSCCFEPFPHACTFVISAFPLLERLTGHRARKRLGRDVISCVPCFKYFKIEIIQNRAIFLNGCDVFSFLTITVIVNGRGKGGNANCSRN